MKRLLPPSTARPVGVIRGELADEPCCLAAKIAAGSTASVRIALVLVLMARITPVCAEEAKTVPPSSVTATLAGATMCARVSS